MIGVTEEQANLRWCPFARLKMELGVPAAVNRDWNGEASKDAMCLGSACMAWRWVASLSVDNPTRAPSARIQNVEFTHGYCGLAGPAA